MKTVDCTPTWSGVAPWLIEVIKSGSPEGVKAAETELKRMAEAADMFRSGAIVKPVPGENKEKTVAMAACNIFFQAVALNYPEIKSGDIDPLDLVEIESSMEEFVKTWVNSNTTQLIVLSPDGFAIHHSDTYKSKFSAIRAFVKWRENYRSQGYYSSTKGRIPLENLHNYCEITTV